LFLITFDYILSNFFFFTIKAALQAQFQQNRNMFQGNGNMMPNTPQALMYQQQQQAAMAMNRGTFGL
jgi:hypothetical protein